MTDIDRPTSYLALPTGIPVQTASGTTIGTVAHVLALPEEDVFDGIILDTPAGHRFADADVVGALYESRVELNVDLTAEELPEPAENPAAISVEAGEKDHLSDKLRRAWDTITGKY
jgi:hypothetical protein